MTVRCWQVCARAHVGAHTAQCAAHSHGSSDILHFGRRKKDQLLQGLTDTAKWVGGWFVIGWTSTGIMKYMGMALLLNTNDILLIGIASFSVDKEKQAILDREKEPIEGIVPY